MDRIERELYFEQKLQKKKAEIATNMRERQNEANQFLSATNDAIFRGRMELQ
jgi:hypothetical protein